MSRARPAALAAAAVALGCARAWLRLSPGGVVRWASGMGAQGPASRARCRSFTFWRMDPRDPRPVGEPRDPRSVGHPLEPPSSIDSPRPHAAARIRDLSAAVHAVAARPSFLATCLEQSVALVMLLSIARVPARLFVGVARAGSTVRAHAWVECDGRVVLGGAQAAAFVPLLSRSVDSAPSAVMSSCPG